MSKDSRDNRIQKDSREEIRCITDSLIDEVDEQAIANMKLDLKMKSFQEDLEYNLSKVKSHSYCPGKLNASCTGERTSNETVYVEKEKVSEVKTNEVHGSDCHCSKCCPNPRPNFLKRNKFTILISIIWLALVILAIGWSPSGETFEAIQTSYVDLIVNFFKMAIFAVAGIATYQLCKKKDE